jgi:hypothetical protein
VAIEQALRFRILGSNSVDFKTSQLSSNSPMCSPRAADIANQAGMEGMMLIPQN